MEVKHYLATTEEFFEHRYRNEIFKGNQPFKPNSTDLKDEIDMLNAQIKGTKDALQLLPATEIERDLNAQIILTSRNVVPTYV